MNERTENYFSTIGYKITKIQLLLKNNYDELDIIQKKLNNLKEIVINSHFPMETTGELENDIINLEEKISNFEGKQYEYVKYYLREYKSLKRRLLYKLLLPWNWGKVNIVNVRAYSENPDINQVENTNEEGVE